jgi:hypothetical protein
MEFIDLSLIIFGKLDSLEYSSKNITDFLVSFQQNELNLLPNPIQVTFLDGSGSKQIERMGFVDSENNLNVAFLPDSINITTQQFVDEMAENQFTSFISECEKIINSIFESLEKWDFRGTRIALIANIYTDQNKLKEQTEIFNNYKGNFDEESSLQNLIEWNNRRTYRIQVEKLGEFINIVKNIGKNEGNLIKDGEVVISNTIQINYDINTAGNQTTPRIDKNFSQEFLIESAKSVDFRKIRGELYNVGE